MHQSNTTSYGFNRVAMVCQSVSQSNWLLAAKKPSPKVTPTTLRLVFLINTLQKLQSGVLFLHAGETGFPVHSFSAKNISRRWPWTVVYVLCLQIWDRMSQGEPLPVRHMSGLKVMSIHSYFANTDKHRHTIDQQQFPDRKTVGNMIWENSLLCRPIIYTPVIFRNATKMVWSSALNSDIWHVL